MNNAADPNLLAQAIAQGCDCRGIGDIALGVPDSFPLPRESAQCTLDLGRRLSVATDHDHLSIAPLQELRRQSEA